MSGFTHINEQGDATMVDVSRKEKTVRRAVAAGRIQMRVDCYQAVRQGLTKKGDVLGVARIAGIMAAKQASALIPLCHTLPLEQVMIHFTMDDSACSISVRCTVITTGRTGVEMEALTGVSSALLTVYDMCKAMDKGMEIGEISLVEKTGGKSGDYKRS